MTWYPTSECLPFIFSFDEEVDIMMSEPVLCLIECSAEVVVGYLHMEDHDNDPRFFIDESGYVLASSEDAEIFVSHWMPIPDLPERFKVVQGSAPPPLLSA